MIVDFEIATQKGRVKTNRAYLYHEICVERMIKDAEMFLKVYPLAEKVSFNFQCSRYSVSRAQTPNCPNDPR